MTMNDFNPVKIVNFQFVIISKTLELHIYFIKIIQIFNIKMDHETKTAPLPPRPHPVQAVNLHSV